MPTMAERWTPASTAKTERLFQPALVERTRNEVVLFSNGPPPVPYGALCQRRLSGCANEPPGPPRSPLPAARCPSAPLRSPLRRRRELLDGERRHVTMRAGKTRAKHAQRAFMEIVSRNMHEHAVVHHDAHPVSMPLCAPPRRALDVR
jgi:hypothetical protein